jgi:hypothetical protein
MFCNIVSKYSVKLYPETGREWNFRFSRGDCECNVFWDLKPFSLVDPYQRFGGTCSLNPEGGRSRFLLNFVYGLPNKIPEELNLQLRAYIRASRSQLLHLQDIRIRVWYLSHWALNSRVRLQAMPVFHHLMSPVTAARSLQLVWWCCHLKTSCVADHSLPPRAENLRCPVPHYSLPL